MDLCTKGDYSRRIPKVIMVVERPSEVNPPSSRVPRQLLLAIPRSDSWQRRKSRAFCMTGFSLGISQTRGKYRPKGDLGGGPPGPGGQRARSPPWPCQAVAWAGVAPLRPSFGLLESSDMDIFLGFFLDFLSTFIFHLYLRCMDKNRQKLALGTGHWALSQ